MGDISKWKSNQCDVWFIWPPMLLLFLLYSPGLYFTNRKKKANLTTFHCVVSLIFHFPFIHSCALSNSVLMPTKIRFDSVSLQHERVHLC